MNKDAKYIFDKDIIYAQSEWQTCDVNWLWHDDWYDGPISGMIEYHGKRYYAVWFETKTQTVPPDEYNDEEHEIDWRIFCVYKLTKEKEEYEEYWHELFDLLVGDQYSPSNPACQFFYGRRKADYEPLDFISGKDGEVVGWFIW